ncbi:MAG: hypothetical protein IPG53_11840 [Ignavibacteriales bacterium]|nr:hypothetical protein [Ignavibacteriales bacterium]
MIAGSGVRISGIIPMAVFLLIKTLMPKRFEDEFFGFIRLGNKASHSFPLAVSNDEVDSCISAFAKIASLLTKSPIPAEIKAIYEERSLLSLKHKTLINKEIVEFISRHNKKNSVAR